MHGNAPHLSVPIGPARSRKELFRILGRFSANAEHVPFVTVKVSLCEAVAGECIFKHLHLFLCGLAMLFQGTVINIRNYSSVFRAFHPPFDFNAGNACVFDLIQTADQAVILQGKRVVIHPPAKTVLHPTGLGTHTAISASSADEGRHVALPGVAEAKSPMHKDFRFDRRIFCNKTNLLQA